MRELFELFRAFATIGAFTFGGGYAMIPLMERELTEKRDWCTNEELMDYYAVGQCTPGMIAVNVATFVGRKRKGVIGGIVASLGMVFPSVVIIVAIAALIQNFAELTWVKSAFAGIRVCVCVLIFNAVSKLWKSAVKDRVTLIMALLVFLASAIFDVSPVVFVLLCAGLGILFTELGVRGK